MGRNAGRLAGFFLLLFSGLYEFLKLRDVVIRTGDQLPAKLYFVLLAGSLVLAGAAGILFFPGRDRKGVLLHRLYFFCGLVLGLLFQAAMPGLSAPDEVSHYITAYRLSNRLMGKPELTEDMGLVGVRTEDYRLEDLSGTKTLEIPDDEEPPAEILGNPVRYATYRTIADWDRRYPFDETVVSSGLPDVRTTPVMYLPQAAGISLARLLRFRAPALVFLAGFMNLLVFLLLTAEAVRRAPFGKELYFGAGLLPMSLHLASSLSYDAGIIGCIFLFTAEILRLAYGKIEDVKAEGGKTEGAGPVIRFRDLLLIVVLIAVFGPCKLVYSVLVFLFFLIPKERFGKGRRILSFLVLFLALTFSMAAVNTSVIRSYVSAGNEEKAAVSAAEAEGSAEAPGSTEAAEGAWDDSAGEGAETAVKRGYPVSELIRRPVFIFRMVCDTFSSQSDELVMGMTGMWLGNLDPLLGLPFFAVLWYLAGLLVLAFRRPGEASPMGAGARLWCGLLVLGVVLLTAGAMLVAWTMRDAQIIEGIQGRYFLPVLPLLLMLMENGLVVTTKDLRRGVLYGFLCMDCFALLRIFVLACMRL